MWAMETFRDSLYVATCSWRLDGLRDWEKWAFSRGPIDTSEGTEIWRLTTHPEVEIIQDRIKEIWSPDGAKIAFTANAPTRTTDWHSKLNLLPADGGGAPEILLEDFDLNAGAPIWAVGGVLRDLVHDLSLIHI